VKFPLGLALFTRHAQSSLAKFNQLATSGPKTWPRLLNFDEFRIFLPRQAAQHQIMATDSRKTAGIAPEQLRFRLRSRFEPRRDQPQRLRANIKAGAALQTMRGFTGSGKTFRIAHLPEHRDRPALVIAPNKTLAAQ
jgi:superfamily II DNA or RNA helicase